MKLVGLVFLGLVAGFAAIYLPVILFSLLSKGNGNAVSGSGGDGDAGLLIGFLVVFPFSFFLGGIVTGYFSYYEIENKSSLLLMAPALYVNLLWLCVIGVQFGLDAFIGANQDNPGPGFVNGVLFPVGMGLLWYLSSAGGVFLGYYLRERFAKWWYRD